MRMERAIEALPELQDLLPLKEALVDASRLAEGEAWAGSRAYATVGRRVVDAGEIEACRWWIDHERALIRPPLTVALGATAARSLVGKVVTISKMRGAPLMLADGGECWVTVHPSFLLRLPDREKRKEERERFVDDLKRIRKRAAVLAG